MKFETKVGIFVFAAILVLSIGVIWKSSLLLRAKGYVINGTFNGVNGLLPGAEVRYRGYLVGTVSKLVPNPYDIRVTLYIKRGIKITEGSLLRVDFDGLIGEKYINIIPNALSKEYIKAGSLLKGKTAAGLVDFVNTGTENLNETKQILEVFRKIITSSKSKKSLQQFILNMDSTTTKLDSVLSKVDSLLDRQSVSEWSDKVDSIVGGLDNLIKSLNAIVGSAEGENKSNVYKMISNLESFTSKLETESGVIMKEARHISSRLDDNTSFLDDTSLNLDASLIDNNEYDLGASLVVSKNIINLSLGNKTGGNVVKLTQLTFGRSIFGKIFAAVGLVEDAPGVKVGHPVFDRIDMEHSFYNASTWMYRLKTNMYFTPNIRGIAGYDYKAQNDQQVFVGVGVNSF